MLFFALKLPNLLTVWYSCHLYDAPLSIAPNARSEELLTLLQYIPENFPKRSEIKPFFSNKLQKAHIVFKPDIAAYLKNDIIEREKVKTTS